MSASDHTNIGSILDEWIITKFEKDSQVSKTNPNFQQRFSRSLNFAFPNENFNNSIERVRSGLSTPVFPTMITHKFENRSLNISNADNSAFSDEKYENNTFILLNDTNDIPLFLNSNSTKNMNNHVFDIFPNLAAGINHHSNNTLNNTESTIQDNFGSTKMFRLNTRYLSYQFENKMSSNHRLDLLADHSSLVWAVRSATIACGQLLALLVMAGSVALLQKRRVVLLMFLLAATTLTLILLALRVTWTG